MFIFVLVELLLFCSPLFLDTVMVLQIHLKDMCFDTFGPKGGEISKVYYLVSGSISQF